MVDLFAQVADFAVRLGVPVRSIERSQAALHIRQGDYRHTFWVLHYPVRLGEPSVSYAIEGRNLLGEWHRMNAQQCVGRSATEAYQIGRAHLLDAVPKLFGID